MTPGLVMFRRWHVTLAAGVLGAIVSCFSVVFRTNRGWHDILDVWMLHGMGGLLGVILMSYFTDPTLTGDAVGLLFGGGVRLLG